MGWNLVDRRARLPAASERTIWVDGEPREVGPVDVRAPTYPASASLRFTEWSAREENRNLLLMRSRYRQPFGTFSGDAARRPASWPRATA